jgi:hypothetical protein
MNRVGFLLGLALLFPLWACESPSSPGTDTSLRVVYQYGLYDNFESPSLNTTLWSGEAEIAYEGGNHIACLTQTGIGKKQIVMNWPYSIAAEVFREWSTRIKISNSGARDFTAGLKYCGREDDLGWCVQAGVRVRDGSSWFFASWINPAAGDSYYASAGRVIPERWYTLKICMKPQDDSTLRIDYYLDGQLFASTRTSDKCKVLGEQIVQPRRKLLVQVFAEPTPKAVCFFDDVFGIYGNASSDI